MTDKNANTADLTTDEKLDRILSELADLKAWRAKVDAEASDRTKTTRPLLDQLIQEMVMTRETLAERMAALEQESKIIRREIGLLREDVRNERMARAELQERVEQIERRPS